MRDTPPYRAIPFRDSIAEGGVAPICLVFIGYRASIAEIPLWGGVSHLHFANAIHGGNAQKKGGVSHPIWPPRGPDDQRNLISLEIFNLDRIFDLARKFQSRRREFPTKNRAAVGGSLENSFSLEFSISLEISEFF